MAERTDIRDRDHIAVVVERFYRRAFADPLIGPLFTDVAHMDLDRHLPIMCDFWETVLFRAGKYRRNAFVAHRSLHVLAPLGEQHFARWLQIWTATLDEAHEGPVTEHAKIQAERIAGSICRRLQRSTDLEPLTIGGPRDGRLSFG